MAADQPEFAEPIANVISCVDRDYAEALSCMQLRQEVMGCSVEHYKKQEQVQCVCVCVCVCVHEGETHHGPRVGQGPWHQ